MRLKNIPVFFALFLLFVVALQWLWQPGDAPSLTESSPAESSRQVPALPDRIDVEPAPDGETPVTASSPAWRPPAVFGQVGTPSPQIPYPRGAHASRRYHDAVSREIDPQLRLQAPAVLAKSPQDGRLELLPEEMDAHTKTAVRMVFDPAALDQVVQGQTAKVLVPTPSEEVLTLEFKKIKTRSANTHTLQGHVVGEAEASTAQFVYHDGILHGNVMRYSSGQEFEYRILADGHMMARELDHSTMTDQCATCSDKILSSIIDEDLPVDQGEYIIQKSEEVTPRDTTGWRTVDVVVGYGQEARIADGGYAQIEARIIDAVDRVTAAFANSGIADAELMLLGTIEDPDYRFSDTSASNMGLEISALRTTNGSDGGALDTVTDFTDQLGGDLTSFIIKEGRGATAGVQSADKYTIVSRTNMTPGRMTFAHEIGHCLGAGHAWGDSSDAVDSVRYAWRFTAPDDDQNYRTIVAYNNGIGGVIIPNPTEAQAGLAHNSAHAIRTNFEVINPVAAARWERGTTQTIQFNGGDMQDLATIELYKGGVLHSTFATNVNPVTHRNFEWTIPFSQTEGTDYMIRVELNRNGSTLFADSGIFEIYSDLPHVTAQSTPTIPEGVGVVSQLALSFNVPMNPATFSVGSDIVSFTDPDGTSVLSSITGTTWSASNTVLTIDFTPFSVSGTYQLVLGPDIEDTLGIKMDQDLDGTVGESLDDRYTANFFVNPPLIHYANMDTDPGWTFSANNPAYGWEWGQPTGGTGPSDGSSYNTAYGIPDPTSGYNGPNVIGYNLDGDYERGISSIRWATTPVLDCSNHKNVTLRFQRWLGVYGSDNASIEVSNDGTNWTTVWNNDRQTIDEERWVEVEYDISAVADGRPTVYVRWGMGTTNSSFNDDSCGWNIDEVIVFGDTLDGILLYAPNGGGSYYAGSTVDLSWASVLGGNVQIELLKNGLVDSTIIASTANDGSYAWPIPVGLTAGTDYRIRITSLDDPSKTVESAADFAINGLPSVPYSESFASGLGDWSQDSADDIEWTWRTGGTPSGSTGPSAAQGGAGDDYFYTEATGNFNKLARISAWFDLRALTQADFSFYYHMYGAAMGTLLVEASTDGLVWTQLFTISGDQGNAWIPATVSLNAFTGDYATIRISGTTGTSFTSDIAVDSFTITGSGAPTFSEWIAGYSVGGLTAPGDDFDNDGIPNAIENYFGTNPGVHNGGLSVSQVTTGESQTFEFTHPINSTPASDITAAYSWSKDLSTFHNSGDSDTGTTVTFTAGDPVDNVVTVTATITGTETDRVFVTVDAILE